MENIQASTSCDEDNTSMAARSLLTLNNGTNSKNQREPILHLQPFNKLQKYELGQAKDRLLINNASEMNVNNSTLDTNATVNIQCVEMTEVVASEGSQEIQTDIVSVRIDRSSGNPDVQIIQTGITGNETSLGDLNEHVDSVEPSESCEEEIYSMVTAVLKKRKDISIQKYMSLCKVSDVTVVYKENICISGTLKAVNDIHDLLKVLYKNTEREQKTSHINGKTVNNEGMEPDINGETLPCNTEEITVSSKDVGNIEMFIEDQLGDESEKDERLMIATSSVSAYKCSICGEILDSDKELIEHCLELHPDEDEEKSSTSKSYKCSHCGKIFQTNQYLIQHTEEIHGPNTCPLCGKEFALKRYLSMHMKRHSDGNKKHACEVCGWKFLERYKLRLHMESHKPRSEKNLPHSCEVCKRQFYNKATLDDHMNTHTGNRPFTCNICSCTFAHRIGLKRHLVTHAKTKPYKCGICQKEFAFKAKLDEHSITHSGEDKYSCGNCGKIFTTKSSLKRHMENCGNKSKENPTVDSAEAVFMCGICSMVFDTLEKASIHAASHET